MASIRSAASGVRLTRLSWAARRFPKHRACGLLASLTFDSGDVTVNFGGGLGRGATCFLLIAAAILATSTQLAAAIPSGAGSASATPAPGLDTEEANLRDALARAQENDHRDALAAFRAVVASPNFPEMTSAERHAALFTFGLELIDAGDYAQAHAMLKQSTALDEATGLDWYERLDASARSGDDADSLLVLTTIATRWPASLDQISDRFIGRLTGPKRADKALAAARFDALSALANAGWKPADPALDADQIWLQLIAMQLARGQLNQAKSVAKSLVTPMAVVEMRSDKAFDAIVQGDPDRYALTEVMSARLGGLRAAVKAAPNDLGAANALSVELFIQNHPDEALSFIDGILAKATPPGVSLSTADSDRLIWILNVRAKVLVVLGRDDEALIALAKAARRPENGAMNVSQTLNLGQM